jgi:transcriptional regulator GlxA family with amidase domain
VDDRVRCTIERMEEQLPKRLPLRALADAVGLSVSQLTRLFRFDTGSTPGAFLHRLRLARARLLVEQTGMPIAEVMKQVGISDRSHFSREFRRCHGLSARTLRVRAARGESSG